jgi:hypothetical protein
LDYIIVGGSGQTKAQIVQEYAEFMAYLGYTGEMVIILEDIDPALIPGVESRVQQITDALTNDELTDIKLIGFSEGAAAIGTFLSRLADDQNIISSSARDELSAAILLECPTGIGGSIFVTDYGVRTLYDLPSELEEAGIDINIANIYNRASMATTFPGMRGWGDVTHSYDSRSWLERSTGLLGRIIGTRFGNYHTGILHNEYAMQVAYQTIYGRDK